MRVASLAVMPELNFSNDLEQVYKFSKSSFYILETKHFNIIAQIVQDDCLLTHIIS